MARENILKSDNTLVSDVWIDQPDAFERLDWLKKSGSICINEKNLLENFINEGYCIFPSELPDAFFSDAINNANYLIENKPPDLLAAATNLNGGRPQPISLISNLQLAPGFRLLDSHSHNFNFEQLTALPKLHRLVSLILGEPCVATQSLYFPFGSSQSLHRDPWFVVTTPVATLVAAWIALEDISSLSGPLSFVPGSHRIPYNPLNTGDIVFHDPNVTEESKAEHVSLMKSQMIEKGLETKEFIAKKGDILIWHASLVHGGSKVINPTLTRHSYVVHFDAARVHKHHAQTIRVANRRPKIVETRFTHSKNGCLFFSNPCVGLPLNDLLGEEI